MSVEVLRPQAGPQEMFLSTPADICIYGGAAGGGKTFGLLMEALRHYRNGRFNAMIFRKEYTQITSPGGLWESSVKIYSRIKGAMPRKSPKLHWEFSSGAKVNFAHIGSDTEVHSWQGSQIAMIGFDELTHFSEYQFFYMLSRNRSDSGVRPYIRATCNPDADSWVAAFISWWIDPESGYPIAERSGKIRWMVRLQESVEWFDTREEAVRKAKDSGMGDEEAEVMPKSVTFIASTLKDNQILLKSNPEYLANLLSLAIVERERLLYGNWKIKPAAGMYFKRSQVKIIEELPDDIVSWARGWDLAATAEDEKGDPAYTASVLIGKRRGGGYVVADVTNQRLSSGEVRRAVLNTAAMDRKIRKRVVQRLPQDPGQAGKAQKNSFIKMLAGYVVKMEPESGSKETRAEPFATQWQNGNVELLLAEWNEQYLSQLESFPESKFKDMVDASSSAFAEIEGGFVASPPPEQLKRASYWKN